jgi:pimeloyl-ACP methyl ester carboxylesterase
MVSLPPFFIEPQAMNSPDAPALSFSSSEPAEHRRAGRWLTIAAASAAVLAGCAWVVRRQTRRAEREFPPRGRFVTVNGVRLHFTVHGRDDRPQTVVLLHGNASLGEDFDISGLTAMAAERYRVIVFDRPGYGHSEPPHGHQWTAEEQADLLHAALRRLGVSDPIVLGHSWGTLVALAMGLRHPQDVGSLVLASGYYFPTLRLDVPLLAGPALPGVGTLMRHTLSPLLGRLLWPLLTKRMFAPAPVTREFRQRFPVWMALRPSQLYAEAAEMAAMGPTTIAMRHRYADLKVPAVLVAGASDWHVNTRWHSARLHERLDRSWLRVVEGCGHMIHHVAPGQVMAAIDQAAGMVWDRSLKHRPPAGLKDDRVSLASTPVPTAVETRLATGPVP